MSLPSVRWSDGQEAPEWWNSATRATGPACSKPSICQVKFPKTMGLSSRIVNGTQAASSASQDTALNEAEPLEQPTGNFHP
jgi:hypothetical protein